MNGFLQRRGVARLPLWETQSVGYLQLFGVAVWAAGIAGTPFARRKIICRKI